MNDLLLESEEVLDFMRSLITKNKQFVYQIQLLKNERDEYRAQVLELQSQLQMKNDHIQQQELIVQECELQLESCRANYEEKLIKIEVQYKMNEMLQSLEITQLSREIAELKCTQHGYSTTAGTSLQLSFNQRQDSMECEQSLLQNYKKPEFSIKRQKDQVKREITQWQEDFFKKEGRPPSVLDKQSISNKFYQYTILKKQLNTTEDSYTCKNMGIQCNLIDINLMQEQLRLKTMDVRRLSFQVEDLRGKIKVYCRVRPSNNTDKLKDCEIQFIDEQNLQCRQKQFSFDLCFHQQCTQKDVYTEIQQSLPAIFHGYNLCIFAYGQTGSGKTYTMFGTKQQPGVIPNLITDLFQSNQELHITISSLEIYKENITDLLCDNVQNLDLKENNQGHVFVQGLTNIKVQNANELLNLIEFAQMKRKQSHTEMNDCSSRSHMITQLIVETYNKITNQRFTSRVNLIDLAGSERCNKLKSAQIEEAKYINKSLSALNDVMIALSTNSQFIPYRNSKLTYLMRDSLGGNSKTIMIVNISPSFIHVEESLSSMQYGQKVKNITCQPIKNIEPLKLRNK